MRREIPDPWATAMLAAGLTDPRNGTRPSMTQLAERVGVHTSTISSMIFGDRATDQATVERAADVLRVSRGVVGEWVGRAGTTPAVYEPPSVASLMDGEQRRVVDQVIRLFAGAGRAQAAVPTPVPVEQAEPATSSARVRPRSPARVRRVLENARAKRAELVAEGDPDLYGVVVGDLDEVIARLEAELSGLSGERDAGSDTGQA